MTTTDSGARQPRWAVAPYFIVDDIRASADYYRDKLGFRYERLWGDPPAFAMVMRSGIVIMLSQVAGAGGSRRGPGATGGQTGYRSRRTAVVRLSTGTGVAVCILTAPAFRPKGKGVTRHAVRVLSVPGQASRSQGK